jgi:UPF0176 protein
MQIENIAGYKFIPLSDLQQLQNSLSARVRALTLKGTILLSKEGINIFLAGTVPAIAEFKQFLATDNRFSDMTFRISYSNSVPFKRLKIKLKNEIITMRRPEINPATTRARSISPVQLKEWLDEKRDITLLDTRNDFEIEHGTFANAVTLNLADFSAFPEAAARVEPKKPVIMFCTGGIRCEKAALHMENIGYTDVYQLDGGILNYFAEVGAAHYNGGCFVFDERVALDPKLNAMRE